MANEFLLSRPLPVQIICVIAMAACEISSGNFFFAAPALPMGRVTGTDAAHKKPQGLERVCRIIVEAWAGTAKEITAEILDHVRKFSGDHPRSGDFTLIATKGAYLT